MARQWFVPGIASLLQGGMIDEDGTEEWFVPGVGMLNEDQAVGNNPDTDAHLFIAGQQQPVIQPLEIVAY